MEQQIRNMNSNGGYWEKRPFRMDLDIWYMERTRLVIFSFIHTMQNGARDQQLTKFWLPYGAHMDEYIYLIFLYKIPESRPFILNKASIKSEVLINGSICNFYEWKWISLLAQYTSITFVFFLLLACWKRVEGIRRSEWTPPRESESFAKVKPEKLAPNGDFCFYYLAIEVVASFSFHCNMVCAEYAVHEYITTAYICKNT